MNVTAMNDQDRWAVVDRDCLLLTIEQSLRVQARQHFFSWTQGALQTLVPHEIMFSATYDAQGYVLGCDVISPMSLAAGDRDTITRAEDGLLGNLVALWERYDRAPLLIEPARNQLQSGPVVPRLMEALGFENLAAHGTWGPTGVVDAFFGFARLGRPLDARLAGLVELVMPHLRAALIRMQPRKRSGASVGRPHALTERETQILRLMQFGRSNAEIGGVLSISPLTVKNHVQKVLRKLGVRNRTQAVGLDIKLARARDE